MSSPFLAEIRAFPYTFAPRDWANCHGQLMPIAQNSALFSLLADTYGGDARQNFGLPDLRGRAPLSVGQGPGLSSRQWGETGGEDEVTLVESSMPPHKHTPVTGALTNRTGLTNNPGNNSYIGQAAGRRGVAAYKKSFAGQNAVPLSNQTLSVEGGSMPHENRQPYLGLRFCICLQGVYPSHN